MSVVYTVVGALFAVAVIVAVTYGVMCILLSGYGRR